MQTETTTKLKHMYKHSKTYRMHQAPHDLNENDSGFPGWGSKELEQMYPLQDFSSLEDVYAKTGFKWHQAVQDLILDTDVELIDKHTFKITAHYESEQQYNKFNKICSENNDICHGWHTYKTGIYYIDNK